MFTHYGCVTTRWFPAIADGPLGPEAYAGTSLAALAPHAKKLLMPRGIRAMNQWSAGGGLGQGNGEHTQVVGSYFTCVPVTPHTDNPFSFEMSTRFQAKPTAPSLDHVCVRALGGTEPFLLRVGGATDTPLSGISYSASEAPFDGFGSVVEAFSSLTGLFRDGPMLPDTYEAARGKSILDLVKSDLESLERADMSLADRHKLEAWKALLDDSGKAVASVYCSAEGARKLGLTAERLTAVDAATDDRVSTQLEGGLDGADLCSNLAVLAALCPRHPVIVLKYPASYKFSGLGLTADSHALSHRMLNPSSPLCEARIVDLITTIDRYYATKFAHLVQQLDSFSDGDGTLLDNTATVWFQEMSDGNAHNLNNLPIVQAGSCGGYFRTGQAVNVSDRSPSLDRGNSEAFCPDPETSPKWSTGTDPALANAPINKYFCNLMNAIGVRAGTDGFPKAGGEAEVIHFGTYDRTEDFASGGTLPPHISDPGEFKALRA